MADIGDGEAINRMAHAKPARRLSEADIRMADIGDGEAINRMAHAKPARRLSEADIRMADIGDGEAINRMADEPPAEPVPRPGTARPPGRCALSQHQLAVAVQIDRVERPHVLIVESVGQQVEIEAPQGDLVSPRAFVKKIDPDLDVVDLLQGVLGQPGLARRRVAHLLLAGILGWRVAGRHDVDLLHELEAGPHPPVFIHPGDRSKERLDAIQSLVGDEQLRRLAQLMQTHPRFPPLPNGVRAPSVLDPMSA
ncbi:hypothetical protein [Methylobacterium sp. WSM2598]|uniref:hypothetical protein n=1 Tax=Methylobacterium sp. WSM2598 TaxID=398261 RepID=UPI0012F69DAF|nr:hypothetical protein [Methylobacterium sp. WSM2598]